MVTIAADGKPSAGGSSASSWLAIPAPIRRLFKLFPLTTYPPTPLPCRSPMSAASSSSSSRPRLYIFSSEEDAQLGRPSFNPACLKWQTLLRIAGVDVDLVPSNNHASPSGSLPFLLPVADGKPGSPVAGGNGMLKFAKEKTGFEVPAVAEHKLEAYKALVTQAIRPAWLYILYLDPSNRQLFSKLYLPTNPLLATPIHHTLIKAAQASILQQTRAATINPTQLLRNALDALSTLSDLLAGDEWFFGASGPGMLDAEVFAYTHLLLDEVVMAWGRNELGVKLATFENLVAHQERLFKRCWKGN